jgi:mannitol/fructose-specific phosphotransferase system IIA component (Ntr-type)
MSRISDYFSKDAIACNVQCDSWRDAVREAGLLLVKTGIVENCYIDKMIKYVEQFGPYIVILPGFALAHARPEDGGLKTGLSLITLKTPVSFGHEDNDPVSIVVALASNGHGTHLECLGDIVQIIDNAEYRDIILSAKDVSEVYKILSK